MAPSKLARPSGDRVKTDARDAMHLARLLRMDEYTPVRVPTVEQESARDLVRAREAARADLMRARHRVSKLLLRHGIVYSGGKAWTAAHDAWLLAQRFELSGTRAAFQDAYETVALTTGRRDRLDKQITVLATEGEYAPLASRLACLRGISTLTSTAPTGADRDKNYYGKDFEADLDASGIELLRPARKGSPGPGNGSSDPCARS